MKYVSQGPMLLDVHMHRPHTTSRNFMDALLAFWPGLQVSLMNNSFKLLYNSFGEALCFVLIFHSRPDIAYHDKHFINLILK